jgi:Skp family chaperone for outer membrane proteins
MKKILTILLAIAFAQNIAFAEQKIAVINVELIVDNALVSKNIAAQLNKKKEELKSDVEKKEQDLGKLNQELVKQESILAKDVFEQKVKDFNNKLADVQREIQGKKNILEQAHIDSMSKIFEEISTIVEKVAKDKNISVVLPSNSTSYFTPDLEITSEILAMLDKKIQKIDVKFDTAAAKK